LKNDALMATLFNTQGDINRYRNNLPAASQQYQKALQTMGRKEEKGIATVAHLNLVRVALQQGHAREAAKLLSPLYERREQFTKTLSIQISTTYSEALIGSNEAARGRQILLSDLGDVEKAGMKPQAAYIYYLLSLAAKSHGDAEEAGSYSRQAVKALDAVRAEPGGEKLLDRTDINALYQECTQALKAAR
jgi:tetratricopeptide (TPR) repeat protein